MAGEWCAAASAMGVDLATFVPTATYGTHFITLEDLRSQDKKIIKYTVLLHKNGFCNNCVTKQSILFAVLPNRG
jgi:hypothetical protein